jgi:predicted permease
VTAASAASEVPLGRNGWTTSILREGREQDRQSDLPLVNFGIARPGYFATLGIPLREGRDFGPEDKAGGPEAAIVNQAAARLLWGGESPIGKRVKFGLEDTTWKTVVGVVGDVRQNAENKRVAQVYGAYDQNSIQTLFFVIRTRGNPTSLTPAVRQLVQRRDPDLPFYESSSLTAAMSKALWEQRLYAWMMGGYSFIALVIAAIGIYGVMAYRVAQRTQEIGIRMALGAPQSAVLRMVVGQGLRLTVLGLGIGLAAAFALTRFMASVLFGVNPNDPPTFAGVAIILSLSALLASWLPAWRASRVDPMRALRHE